MVVFSILCADFSEDFINFVPGLKIEEKVLTLQDRLGGGFPNIILQYLSDDKNQIIQIKGNYQDVISAHTVLDAWVKREIDVLNSSLPETGKNDHVIDGALFSEEKMPETTFIDQHIFESGTI